MGNSPLSASSGSGFATAVGAPFPAGIPQSAPPSEPVDLLEILRQSLASGTQPTDSIFRAAVDAARVLTGAHGTALALRTDGAIVCRARSGDIAPELGSRLNTDSGISGECLRTAHILVCNDSTTDDRVDPEVCRALGIRSIVVVPLRGAKGISGILEAFSALPNAFGDEQIDHLRRMAEIAETAYERERVAQDATLRSRAALFDPPTVTIKSRDRQAVNEAPHKRRYWIPGIVAAVLLAASAVVWLTWREPISESAASERPAQSAGASQATTSHPPLSIVLLKPDPGIASRRSERLQAKSTLQDAAEIDPVADGTSVPNPAATEALANNTSKADPPPASNSTIEPPPSINMASSTKPVYIAGLTSSRPVVPTLEAAISTGVTEAKLIHKVEPVYPQQARMQRLTGSVLLNATIGEDGAIRGVNTISGAPVLAAAATEAVRQWRYTPTLLNGKPVEIHQEITIVFKLP